MVQLAIASLLVGAVFGLRFQVIALIPITVIGSATVGAAALLTGQPSLAVLYSVATYALALQCGYLVGSLSRFTVAAARGARLLPARSPAKSAR